MATSVVNQAVGTLQSLAVINGSISNVGRRHFGVIQATASQASVFDHVLSPSNNTTSDTKKSLSMVSYKVLIKTADRYGKEQVHEWRKSYDVPPPNGRIEPQLRSGKNVMIAAHGNSLRSIIMYLDKLTSQEVISLELSIEIPLLYIFKNGKFMRRGSPVEAGVYAYTRRLALYRQKLDDMSN
ncbi:hypothetical protein ACFE04_001086 [Oxalis oulophora]